MPFAKSSFLLFSSVNILAALHAPILDCDEVFNYWEPTHYLNYGYGLQTWEYSPEYAIRSWLYIGIHAFIGRIVAFFAWGSHAKRHEFIGIRITLAIVCAYCQTQLCSAVARRVEARVALLMALAMAFNTGMFYASVAYLPSSFSMYTTMLGLSAFLNAGSRPGTAKGILWFGIGAVVGWPFAGALILPLLADELACIMKDRHLIGSIKRCGGGVSSLVPFIVLDISINALCFHRLAFSPWRIVSYNIFSGSTRGPDIFGTEPWHFYLRNLLLNFNIWFLLALMAGPVLAAQLLLRRQSTTKLSLLRSMVFAAPFYLWLVIFSAQPHKEERFMYPAYPFLTFNAAITLHTLLHYIGHATKKSVVGRLPATARAALVIVSLSTFVLIGCLRTFGTVTAYRAPLQVYKPLQAHEWQNLTGSVCLGKEWYRFPSSYHLPSSMRARFVRSEFRGLLPGQFAEGGGFYGLRPTWSMPFGMNDQNIEDPSKYVDSDSCAFMIDSRFKSSTASKFEPDRISDTESWIGARCADFLDATSTHVLGRLFWLPDWSVIPPRYRRKWAEYCLLQRKARESPLL